jgi:hypothetical protein
MYSCDEDMTLEKTVCQKQRLKKSLYTGQRVNQREAQAGGVAEGTRGSERTVGKLVDVSALLLDEFGELGHVHAAQSR